MTEFKYVLDFRNNFVQYTNTTNGPNKLHEYDKDYPLYVYDNKLSERTSKFQEIIFIVTTIGDVIYI